MASRHVAGLVFIVLTTLLLTFPSRVQAQDVECDLGNAPTLDKTTGNYTCTSCTAGYFSNTTSTEPCLSCEIGRYNDGQGRTVCKNCPSNTYAIWTGMTSCLPCVAGTVSSNGGCANCTAGTFSGGAVDECSDCTKGKYSQEGASACITCDTNMASNTTGATACSLCGLGQQPDFNRIECVECNLGYFAAEVGVVKCSRCRPGEYGPSVGGTQCFPCETGSFGRGFIQSTCSSCAVGMYQNQTQQTDCNSCPVGTQAPSEGMDECEACPAGRASNSTQVGECSFCESGQYAPSTGLTACLSCGAGTFSNVGSSSCMACPVGTTSASGNAFCSGCSPGFFAKSAGRTSCVGCGAGMYNDAGGASACLTCASGRYSSTVGASLCSLCPKGTFQNGTDFMSCVRCAPGSWGGTEGLTACRKCPVGKSSPDEGSTHCSACSQGFHNEVEGSPNCFSCPLGKWMPSEGASECLACSLEDKILVSNTTEYRDLAELLQFDSFQLEETCESATSLALCVVCLDDIVPFTEEFATTTGDSVTVLGVVIGMAALALSFIMNAYEIFSERKRVVDPSIKLWALVEYLQFVVLTGQIGGDLSPAYTTFTNSFSWAVLGIGTPIVRENIVLPAAGGRRLSMGDYVDFAGLSAEDHFAANVFFVLGILGTLVALVLLINLVSLTLIAFGYLKRQQQPYSLTPVSPMALPIGRNLEIDFRTRLRWALSSMTIRLCLVAYYSVCVGCLYHLTVSGGSTFSLTLAVFVITLFCVGLPLFNAVLVSKNRAVLFDSEELKMKYGNLYMAYNKKKSLFHVGVLVKKLVLATLIAFMQSQSEIQVVLLLLTVIAYGLALLYWVPHRHRSTFYLELYGTSAAVLVLFIKMISQWSVDSNTWIGVEAVLFIALHILSFMLYIFLIIRDAIPAVRMVLYKVTVPPSQQQEERERRERAKVRRAKKKKEREEAEKRRENELNGEEERGKKPAQSSLKKPESGGKASNNGQSLRREVHWATKDTDDDDDDGVHVEELTQESLSGLSGDSFNKQKRKPPLPPILRGGSIDSTASNSGTPAAASALYRNKMSLSVELNATNSIAYPGRLSPADRGLATPPSAKSTTDLDEEVRFMSSHTKTAVSPKNKDSEASTSQETSPTHAGSMALPRLSTQSVDSLDSVEMSRVMSSIRQLERRRKALAEARRNEERLKASEGGISDPAVRRVDGGTSSISEVENLDSVTNSKEDHRHSIQTTSTIDTQNSNTKSSLDDDFGVPQSEDDEAQDESDDEFTYRHLSVLSPQEAAPSRSAWN